jgi:hypothetical protein
MRLLDDQAADWYRRKPTPRLSGRLSTLLILVSFGLWRWSRCRLAHNRGEDAPEIEHLVALPLQIDALASFAAQATASTR